MESWINAREGASENPTNVRFSQGGEKQKNPTRSSFLSDSESRVRMDEFQP
ncbi:hypothetical protein [Commensalibacter melissae]|nr:hypothetical protein [Commensalibacter melissae]MUH07264.1 hypothetical protein [Commensalibacter melissae]